MTTDERILVMGIGNVLMKDEGVGCRVIEVLLERYAFPDNVEVLDSGTMGMTILNLFKDRDFVLVVDAVDGTEHPPGTVIRLEPEDIAQNQVMHSLHDIRFVDVLESAELMGIRPAAHCIGVQVEDMSPAELTIGLSDSVEGALDTAVDAVLTVLREHGVDVEERTGASGEDQSV